MKKINEPVLTLASLSYAENVANLHPLSASSQHLFVCGDVRDSTLLQQLFDCHHPGAVVHFAAESHGDRSIHGPEAFVETNVVGTLRLLEAARQYWNGLEGEERSSFLFLHVSTGEAYGTLDTNHPAFTENTPYASNSPYSASKAASDHIVRTYHHTYGLPTLTTNCYNNYGPYHFPEKPIPLILVNALAGKPLPIFGDGRQIRDWLYVEDHCSAIQRVLEAGCPGETYNIGGWNEKANIDIVSDVCNLLGELAPAASRGVVSSRTGKPVGHYAELVEFVADRPGHDRRYAIDARKIERELDWRPAETFETGIRKTVQWYLDNQDWVQNVQSGAYRDWIKQQYAEAG